MFSSGCAAPTVARCLYPKDLVVQASNVSPPLGNHVSDRKLTLLQWRKNWCVFLPIIYPRLLIQWPRDVIPIFSATQQMTNYCPTTPVLHHCAPFFWFVPKPGPALVFVFELPMLERCVMPGARHRGNLILSCINLWEDIPPALKPRGYSYRSLYLNHFRS